MSPELRNRIASRHRSGEGGARKVSKSTVTSIVLKRKEIGTTRILLRAGRPTRMRNVGKGVLEMTSKEPACRWENISESQRWHLGRRKPLLTWNLQK